MLLGLEVGLGVLMLAGLMMWLVALVDALRRPSAQWQTAGHSQIVWIVVILFAPVVGALLYWLIARPQLGSQTV